MQIGLSIIKSVYLSVSQSLFINTFNYGSTENLTCSVTNVN